MSKSSQMIYTTYVGFLRLSPQLPFLDHTYPVQLYHLQGTRLDPARTAINECIDTEESAHLTRLCELEP